jgi:hypothetical protein
MMARCVVLLALVVALAGCHSVWLGPYVSPRVTGQVLAADSREPLAGVKVLRGPQPRPSSIAYEPKGAELLMRRAPAETGRDGRFTLPSERVLAFLWWGGWSSVRLTFEHPGYRLFKTNYPSTNLNTTNAPDGTPWLDAGEILLVPQGHRSPLPTVAH